MQRSRIVKMRNGKISLPLRLRSLWEQSNVYVREMGSDRIVLERVSPKKKKVDIEAWKRVAGILRGRRIPNPVKWQQKIRSEWERTVF